VVVGGDQLKRRKVLFSLMFSVHAHLDPLLWACGEAENHGREKVRRQEEAKAGYGSKDISPLTYFLQLGCTS
jgi:hypothetical protein